MMIKICCVGKLKDSFFVEGCAEYIKRLSRYCELRVCEVADEKAPETLSAAETRLVREKEGNRLLTVIEPKDHVIAMTIDGKRYSSERFAKHMEDMEANGVRTIAFAIGGSTGLSDAVIRRADETMSLSDLTMPHRIARLVLLEQIYRSYKIRRNEAYHK